MTEGSTSIKTAAEGVPGDPLLQPVVATVHRIKGWDLVKNPRGMLKDPQGPRGWAPGGPFRSPESQQPVQNLTNDTLSP